MARKKSRVVAAIERARSNLTQEVLSRAMTDLPASTTLGEVVASMRLAGFAKEFEAMNLQDFVSALGNRAGRGPGKAKRGAGRSPRKKLNTRTNEGRERLDAAVAKYLTSAGAARAEVLREAIGGSAAQVRQSLGRLMKAKQVTKKGQKRATEYMWRGGAGKPKSGRKRKGRSRRGKAQQDSAAAA